MIGYVREKKYEICQSRLQELLKVPNFTHIKLTK